MRRSSRPIWPLIDMLMGTFKLPDKEWPDSYGVFFSILLLVGAVAGGVGSVWGALAGGALIQYLPDLAANASAALSLPAYGLLLIVLMYVMPDGLSGLVNALRTRIAPHIKSLRRK